MSSIAFFDCFSGAAGDMILGALIDAGMPLAHLKKQLKLVSMGSYEIIAKQIKDNIAGTDVRVLAKRESAAARYADIDRAIVTSRLPAAVREQSRAIMRRIAEAEARVHGVPVNRVHLHEVGAVDSLVDVVGSAIGFDYFGFKEIHSSPLPMSRGIVKTAHGELPVPAPATLEIIKGIPLERTKIREEMVTPTGAAILATVATRFGECPLQKIERVGVGFGDKKIPGRPNCLRLLIGEGFSAVEIETDIDDMNPQLFDNAMKELFVAGAVDVTLQPIQMKKNRPGVRLSCIAPWDSKDRVIDAMLAETTTFGVRYWPAERKMLTREFVKAKVKKGSIVFKVGRDSKGRIVKAMPEFEDVKRLARKGRRPLMEVYFAALSEARKLVK
ncbi:MAG: nickel pincer cofactor biosynthesis protein LarC [bacterium]